LKEHNSKKKEKNRKEKNGKKQSQLTEEIDMPFLVIFFNLAKSKRKAKNANLTNQIIK
jgi:hypothetical protein